MTPATGVECGLCGGLSVLAEVREVAGVSGVLVESCLDCGAVHEVPRRAPSEAEVRLAASDALVPSREIRGSCSQCGLPLDSLATVCADCRREMHRLGAAISAERGPDGLYVGECRTGCGARVTWASARHPRHYCERCIQRRRSVQRQAFKARRAS